MSNKQTTFTIKRWQFNHTLLSLLACIALAFVCLLLGPDGFVSPSTMLSIDERPLLLLRLQRTLLGCLVGASLAAVGATLQCILKNPLADPYIIGVSGGAALGGALALCLSTTSIFLMAGSLLGALGSMVLLLWLARKSTHPESLLLLGIVFNAFAAALITFIKVWVSPEKIQQLVFWLVGMINYPDTKDLIINGILVVICFMFLWFQRGAINLLVLGDDEAQRLGVSPAKVRFQTYLCCCLMVGFLVPQVGMIGFVGLIIPHVVRLQLGPDFKNILPASLFAGAFFLMLCDAMVRGAFKWVHTEIPVGALTAVIGGPFFAWLLLKQYGQR